MKKLSDADIQNMITNEFVPDIQQIHRQVRQELQLSKRIPEQKIKQNYAKIDFHNLTEEQAWQSLLALVNSGVKTATVITGASGILKVKFQQWATDSIISPYIESITPLNNGSFSVKFHTKKTVKINL